MSSTRKTPVPTTTITHERDIPGLATQATSSKAETCSTELSFCLPTSLAFAKRLAWEQTPWIEHTANNKSANPINMLDAQTISQYLTSHLRQPVTVQAVQNAVLFGSTYPVSPPTPSFLPSSSSAHLSTSPVLFIIFPHAKGHNTSRNPSFLRTWHDQIVKPAFDRAWKDSGLAAIHGAEPDAFTRIPLPSPPTGTSTCHDAFPAKGFLARLRSGSRTRSSTSSTRTAWPAWTTENWGPGTEGAHSGTRARILDEAWTSICGMLAGHPDLGAAYQDPVLLAVCRARIFVAEEMSTEGKVRAVAQEWDKVVDARFVRRGSLRVVFQSVVGGGEGEEEGDVVEQEMMPRVWVGDQMGRNFKRLGEEGDEGVVGEDEDRHRSKRVKRDGDGPSGK